MNCSYVILPCETNIDQWLTLQLAIDQLGDWKRLDCNLSESELVIGKY